MARLPLRKGKSVTVETQIRRKRTDSQVGTMKKSISEYVLGSKTFVVVSYMVTFFITLCLVAHSKFSGYHLDRFAIGALIDLGNRI